jgi:hypothetical protein
MLYSLVGAGASRAQQQADDDEAQAARSDHPRRIVYPVPRCEDVTPSVAPAHAAPANGMGHARLAKDVARRSFGR